MTNEEIQQRTELIQNKIDDIKFRQKMEDDEEIAKCYNGLIDDLELIIINLPVPETDYARQQREEDELLQHKADMAREEYNKMIEEEKDELNSKEYQERMQEENNNRIDLENSQK